MLEFNSKHYRELKRTIESRPGVISLGTGQTRAGYLAPSKKVVYKVPLNAEGLGNNCGEAWEYRSGRGFLPKEVLARCRMAPSGILVMEFVQPLEIIDLKTLPPWADWVDCWQIGHNRDGRLVAYDWVY